MEKCPLNTIQYVLQISKEKFVCKEYYYYYIQWIYSLLLRLNSTIDDGGGLSCSIKLDRNNQRKV